MTLFSGLGTGVHFSGDETGLQWEDYLFETITLWSGEW